eukprot:TRINITY_DN2174_c0_g1_i1.p1 TRINITY_DN2174_c0_g1~~TRINITY_DN2174_c0_g1_i1.p1  ORF type:complete len:197 (+),score=56.59 TRINITY_DN2174_c0_g1_i1:61-651(+)
MSTSSTPSATPTFVENALVWVDLEMTGLDLRNNQIIEAAVIVTDGELNIIAEGPNLVIHAADEILDGMNEWCRKQHGESGLTKRARTSQISLQEADAQFTAFIQQHVKKGEGILAGNSIYSDKKFLEKDMPTFLSHLHYRMVDVSSVKELCRRWYPTHFNAAPKKSFSHRALDDIRESIEELRYYRSSIFIPPTKE